MTKKEFIAQLREKLSGLPQADIEERVIFYSEMIDDRIEDGIDEQEAVSAVGSIDEIILQTISDIPLARIIKKKSKSRKKLSAWQIMLLIVGSPIWASLLISLVAVIFSLWVSLWAVIISLWAAFASFIGGSLMGIALGIASITTGNTPAGILLFGSAVTLIGLAILLFLGCKAATRARVSLTKNLLLFIKKCFVRREEA